MQLQEVEVLETVLRVLRRRRFLPRLQLPRLPQQDGRAAAREPVPGVGPARPRARSIANLVGSSVPACCKSNKCNNIVFGTTGTISFVIRLIALIIFSAHLLLLASLVWSDGLWRRVLAVLLAIAGLGYFADSLIAFTLPDVTFRFALFTFAGELALIVWLFAAGGRGVSPPASGCSGS